MTMAKAPLAWFQLLDPQTGKEARLSRADSAAITQRCRTMPERSFRVVARRIDKKGAEFHMWIQFNPGYWETVARKKAAK